MHMFLHRLLYFPEYQGLLFEEQSINAWIINSLRLFADQKIIIIITLLQKSKSGADLMCGKISQNFHFRLKVKHIKYTMKSTF